MRHPRRKIPIALRRKIREQAHFRCGYCLCSEVLIGMSMEFEHLHPLASGGDTIENNLWLSCRRCNEAKGKQTKAVDPEASDIVALFNPREQVLLLTEAIHGIVTMQTAGGHAYHQR